MKLGGLRRKELGRILVEPQDSVIREYTQLLALDDVELRFVNERLEHLESEELRLD